MLASATVVSGRELQPLDDYTVTTWTTVKDDLPSGIVWSIAQDPDGSLWLGTSSGLVRFDGFRFTRWQNPDALASSSGFVRVVTCARDGSLWVGSGERDGGITHISGQDVHTYGVDDGLGRGLVVAIVEDAQGTIWAVNASGLYRFSGGHWQVTPTPETAIQTAFASADGDLLIATSTSVWLWKSHTGTFQKIETSDGFRGRMLTQDARGAVWITDPLAGIRRLGQAVPATPRARTGQCGSARSQRQPVGGHSRPRIVAAA
jgi:ligand-binding sensor domain-containing protein